MAIECRNRKNTQGVDWIEQLNTKKEDISADTLIVVSSSKFSPGVINIAKNKGIHLRYIKTFNPNETEKWFGATIVEIETRNIELESIKLRIDNYDPTKDSTVNTEGISIYNLANNDKKVNLIELLNGSSLYNHILWNSNPNLTRPQKCTLEFKENESPFYIKRNNKKLFIRQIIYKYRINVKKGNAPLSSISSYSDAQSGSKLASSANFITKIGKDNFTVRLLKDEATGNQIVKVDSTAQIKSVIVDSTKK